MALEILDTSSENIYYTMKNESSSVYCPAIEKYVHTAQSFEECIIQGACYEENSCPYIDQFTPMNKASVDNLKFLMARINKTS